MDVKTISPPQTTPDLDLDSDLSDPILEGDFDDDGKGLRYDPEMVAARYRGRFWHVAGRLFDIVFPFLTFVLSLWWDRRTGSAEKNQRRRAVKIREILTKLGPAYIKIGQALSTRPDLVPPLYLEELSQLQDQLPPFPNEVAFRFIEEELGASPAEIYAELSENPVAAASLGQVYKGKLKTGEAVAVKVQRPDLLERVALDLYLLRSLAIWVQKRVKRLRSDLVAILDEFAARIFEEMDYSHEAQNAERFANLYGHLRDIYVPQIYETYTRRRVLTMEWISGTKLTNLEAISAKGIDARYLIEVGVQCSLRQLLEHGFFHADPHPGNLLAMDDGKLAYLDFGMMSEVKSYQRYGLIEAVVHLVNRDFEGLANDYIKLEFLSEDTDLTPIIPALSEVFNNALGASVAELNFKSITDKLSRLMYEYPFKVPAYYALIIRSLVTLEGIAINVDPEFKVLSKAYPYVAQRLLTDPSPELRNSLQELLFKDDRFRWNRLENLLNNAKGSEDYDLANALNQALEFLFSERGEGIRDRLVDEIVKNADLLSIDAVQNTNAALNDWLDLNIGLNNGKSNGKGKWNGNRPKTPAMSDQDRQNLEHIKRIWAIVQDTPGFDPMKFVRLVPGLLAKPETQQMGQEIVSSLAQRAAARLIRNFVLTGDKVSSGPVISPERRLPPVGR